MNTFFTHLKKAAQDIRLTQAEKRRMYAQLQARILLHTPAVESPYRHFLTPRFFAAGTCLALLVIGGGTAYAARRSLPDDALYPIKIHVTERVETAFAPSPLARAEINAALAERRVQEIETLAERGTLNATTTTRAEKNFNYHASQVEAFAKNDPDTEAVAALTTRAATSLDTLGTALAETGARKKDEATQKNSKLFADTVRRHAQIILDSGKGKKQSTASTTLRTIETGPDKVLETKGGVPGLEKQRKK